MPADFEDLKRNYATHAAQALPQLIDAATEDLGISEREDREILGAALARAYLAGADAGQSEMIAQAAEQGFDIHVEQLRPE